MGAFPEGPFDPVDVGADKPGVDNLKLRIDRFEFLPGALEQRGVFFGGGAPVTAGIRLVVDLPVLYGAGVFFGTAPDEFPVGVQMFPGPFAELRRIPRENRQKMQSGLQRGIHQTVVLRIEFARFEFPVAPVHVGADPGDARLFHQRKELRGDPLFFPGDVTGGAVGIGDQAGGFRRRTAGGGQHEQSADAVFEHDCILSLVWGALLEIGGELVCGGGVEQNIDSASDVPVIKSEIAFPVVERGEVPDG